MRKVTGLVLLAMVLTSFAGNVDKDVYICDSKTAKKYHYSKYCRGLNACTHDIKKITKEKARKLGRTLCGWED